MSPGIYRLLGVAAAAVFIAWAVSGWLDHSLAQAFNGMRVHQ